LGKHANLPFHIYVNIRNDFLGAGMPPGLTRGIWHGIYAREHQTLMCHVFLESGANWSGLPIHALSTSDNFDFCRKDLMPWSAMGEDTQTWHSHYLSGLSCNVHSPFQGAGRHTGIIIDWADGYSRYPAEHKPLNLIELNSGQFALLPNNFATYNDSHFVDVAAKENLKFYKRNELVFWED
jgi:hypothetical protein